MYNQEMIGTIDVNCIKLNGQLCLTKSHSKLKERVYSNLSSYYQVFKSI